MVAMHKRVQFLMELALGWRLLADNSYSTLAHPPGLLDKWRRRGDGFFLCAAADEQAEGLNTADVNSLVRD